MVRDGTMSGIELLFAEHLESGELEEMGFSRPDFECYSEGFYELEPEEAREYAKELRKPSENLVVYSNRIKDTVSYHQDEGFETVSEEQRAKHSLERLEEEYRMIDEMLPENGEEMLPDEEFPNSMIGCFRSDVSNGKHYEDLVKQEVRSSLLDAREASELAANAVTEAVNRGVLGIQDVRYGELRSKVMERAEN